MDFWCPKCDYSELKVDIFVSTDYVPHKGKQKRELGTLYYFSKAQGLAAETN